MNFDHRNTCGIRVGRDSLTVREREVEKEEREAKRARNRQIDRQRVKAAL